mmetsp:Transcript_110411/g.356130  ORF Transcript_110411/g.356130 Transcript_110411/m.356130 type:complete len:806 (+) Transcript_110411:776-3193(+)
MRSVHAPAGQLAASAVAAGRCGGRAGRLEGLEGSPARVPTYSIAAQDGTEALRAIRAAILGIRVAPTPGLVPARSADHARGPAVAPDLVLTIFVLDHAPLAHWVFVRVAASGGASDAVTLVDPRRLARAAVPRLSEDLDGVAGRRQSGRRGIGALVVFVVVVVVVVGGCGGAGGRHEARGDRVQRFSAAARAAGRGGRALALDRVALKGPPLSAPANRVAPNLVAPGMLDVALACVAVDVGPLRDIRAPLGQLAAPAVAAGLGGAAAVDGEGAEIAQRLFPADAVAASDGAEAVHPVDTAILSLLVSPTLWFVDACLRDDAGRPAIAPALLLTSHILDDAPIPQGVLVRVAAGVLARQVVLAPLLLARTTAPGLPLQKRCTWRRGQLGAGCRCARNRRKGNGWVTATATMTACLGRGAFARYCAALESAPLLAPSWSETASAVAPCTFRVFLARVAIRIRPVRKVCASRRNDTTTAVAASLQCSLAFAGKGLECAPIGFPSGAVAAQHRAEASEAISAAAFALRVGPPSRLVSACLGDKTQRSAIRPALLLALDVLHYAPVAPWVLVRVAASAVAREVTLAPLLPACAAIPRAPSRRRHSGRRRRGRGRLRRWRGRERRCGGGCGLWGRGRRLRRGGRRGRGGLRRAAAAAAAAAAVAAAVARALRRARSFGSSGLLRGFGVAAGSSGSGVRLRDLCVAATTAAARLGGQGLASCVALEGAPLFAPTRPVAAGAVTPSLLHVARATVAVAVRPIRGVGAARGRPAPAAVAAGRQRISAVDREGGEGAPRGLPTKAVATERCAEAI